MGPKQKQTAKTVEEKKRGVLAMLTNGQEEPPAKKQKEGDDQHKEGDAASEDSIDPKLRKSPGSYFDGHEEGSESSSDSSKGGLQYEVCDSASGGFKISFSSNA